MWKLKARKFEHKASIDSLITSIWPNASAESYEVVQSLWSDYGAIVRIILNTQSNEDSPQSLVAKVVSPPTSSQHPRGWNTDVSKTRKLRSYQVERRFYDHYAQLCPLACRVPRCYGSTSDDNGVLLILEDLDRLYPVRCSQLNVQETKSCLHWLAAFHAKFFETTDSMLWERGTYWHLQTRIDEFNAMPDGPLKQAAHELDATLNACQFKTLLHGDAKVANFCFNSACDQVAAVDFQYTGSGCGMQDVAYFLGSCLAENELQRHENQLLDGYFQALANELSQFQPHIDPKRVEAEWRSLYSVSGADFHRFLSGWSPGHKKLTTYSASLVTRALHITDNHS